MSTERLNINPRLLRAIVREQLWGPTDFFLLDVGASGGVEEHWMGFGESLRAIGFEPLVTEAERLKELAQGSKVSYEAAFVTCHDFDRLLPREIREDRIRAKNNDPFPRVSAVRAQELLRMNYAEHVFNAGAPAIYADRRIVLDDFIPATDHQSVDFVKIDTDGHDFEVLLGTDAIVRSGGVLGMSIEAQFHGAVHDYANTFSNIDRWMRARGFSLFDLEVYRYSRAALPAPFVYDIPAQTTTGQALWGEAVYFRDLGDSEYARMWSYEPTRERVLKLASLFDLFGLPDCAAELLLVHSAIVGGECERLLDVLASRREELQGAYRELMRTFDSDPEALYFSRRVKVKPPPPAQPETPPAVSSDGHHAVGAPEAAMKAEMERLQRRVAKLKEKTSELLDRVKRRDEKIEQLTRRLGEPSRQRS